MERSPILSPSLPEQIRPQCIIRRQDLPLPADFDKKLVLALENDFTELEQDSCNSASKTPFNISLGTVISHQAAKDFRRREATPKNNYSHSAAAIRSAFIRRQATAAI